MTDADLIVVGAGPAGLGTAIYAALAGLSVVVLEPRPTPIDKACGEGLMPGAVRALAEIDVRPDGRPFRGIRYTDGRRHVDAIFRSGSGLGVRRTELQAALVGRARAAGVTVIGGRVREAHCAGSRVVVDGRPARYLAVADGLHSPLRRQLGLDRRSPGRVRPRWGVRQHFAVPAWTDLVEVHWAAHAEAYVTPVGDNMVGVAVLSNRQAPFATQLEDFPALRTRLGGEVVTGPRGAGPMRQRSSARVSGRVLLVGDAAGYVDALTGEGIAVSLACARRLVDCVIADEPERYEHAWAAASRRYRTITTALLWARRRRLLAPRIVPAAVRLPGVFGAAVRALADD
jgi:flavin-dependent dehydrogenase